MNHPLIYFSGYWGPRNNDEDWIHNETGLRGRCVSYAYCGPESELYDRRHKNMIAACVRHECGMFLDSGAFTFFKKLAHKNSDPAYLENFIAQYRSYVAKTAKKWDFYVNFDYVKHAPTVWKMQKKLEKMGMRPAPVFHGDDGFDWLERYCDAGYTYLMIGRVETLGSDPLRRYYGEVFERLAKHPHVKPHGLMVTGQNIWRFPWHSVDSASWLKVAAFGSLLFVDTDRKRIHTIKVTERELPWAERELIERTSKYSLRQLQSHYRFRGSHNILQTMQITRDKAWIEGQPLWASIL